MNLPFEHLKETVKQHESFLALQLETIRYKTQLSHISPTLHEYKDRSYSFREAQARSYQWKSLVEVESFISRSFRDDLRGEFLEETCPLLLSFSLLFDLYSTSACNEQLSNLKSLWVREHWTGCRLQEFVQCKGGAALSSPTECNALWTETLAKEYTYRNLSIYLFIYYTWLIKSQAFANGDNKVKKYAVQTKACGHFSKNKECWGVLNDTFKGIEGLEAFRLFWG